MCYKTCKFELCPHDTGAVVLDATNDADTWREAKKIFKNNGHKNGKYLL